MDLLKFGPRPALSLYSYPNGSKEWKECNVLNYNEEKRVFVVEFMNGQKKEVKRLNLMFSYENEESFEERRVEAQEKKRKFNSIHKMDGIIKKMVDDASTRIVFPEQLMNNILRK
jgi:hypothetical protein